MQTDIKNIENITYNNYSQKLKIMAEERQKEYYEKSKNASINTLKISLKEAANNGQPNFCCIHLISHPEKFSKYLHLYLKDIHDWIIQNGFKYY